MVVTVNLKPLKKLTGLDYELSKSVQYTEEFVQQIMPNPFLVGNILTISVSTTATAFNHLLGQQPQGWIVLDKDSDVRVWRTAWNDDTITLDASGSSNIKVWVF